MNLVKFETDVALADQVALTTFSKLKSKIEETGTSTWVLAGGTTPGAAYKVIAEKYASELDWQKVWFILGDERHVDLESPDSNWGQINNALLKRLDHDNDKTLMPDYVDNVESMAKSYVGQIEDLPKSQNNMPRFDVVWLGLGEDGHTLSLFPGQDFTTNELVVPVFYSPKAPKQRISLSLCALKSVDTCLIIASGDAKAEAVKGLMNNDSSLPIVKVVQTIEEAGGEVTLLVDKLAAKLL
jgi:6-phosphogluconolactonase